MTSTYLLKKRLRGRISYTVRRYTKANNKCINDYDPKKPSTFITYLDMNNLYGWRMSEYLPYGGFKWLKNVDKFDVMSVSEKSSIGYFLEIYLKYPDELHELHNDYPLLQKNFLFLAICCQNIVKKLMITMR